MSANSLYEKFMIVKEEASNIYSFISCIKGIHIAYLVETMQKLDGEEESMLNTCANKMKSKTFSNQRKEARVRQENVKVIRQIMVFFVGFNSDFNSVKMHCVYKPYPYCERRITLIFIITEGSLWKCKVLSHFLKL